MPDERRIVFLTKRREAASTRYRATMYFDALRQAGWTPTHLAADDAGLRWGGILRQVRQAEVTVVCRRTYSALFSSLLRRRAKRLVFDLDDAIYTTPHGPSAGRARRFAAIAQRCDQIWAGNAHLAEQAGRYCLDVRVLPTAVDPAHYAVRPPKPTDTFDAVWIGSSSTRPYLKSLLPVLEAAARVPGLRLKIVADFTLSSSRLPILAVPWSAQTEARELASSHVGLAPMPENPWTLGKCGLKVLQYMAAGLPVVAADVGVHRQLIESAETGLLCADAEGWSASLSQLREDPALRAAMGQAGWERMMADYSLSACTQKLLASLDALMR